MNAAYALYLWRALWRALVIQQFVVLERERQIASAGMTNDVDASIRCRWRQLCRERRGRDLFGLLAKLQKRGSSSKSAHGGVKIGSEGNVVQEHPPMNLVLQFLASGSEQ